MQRIKIYIPWHFSRANHSRASKEDFSQERAPKYKESWINPRLAYLLYNIPLRLNRKLRFLGAVV